MKSNEGPRKLTKEKNKGKEHRKESILEVGTAEAGPAVTASSGERLTAESLVRKEDDEYALTRKTGC